MSAIEDGDAGSPERFKSAVLFTAAENLQQQADESESGKIPN
jgi:hypothetical protein